MDLVNDSPRVLGNRYEIGDLLGRGGMAEVHLGRDARLGRTVAVKLLRTDLARDPTFQARFRREAQSAAALNHPSIVAVYDTGEDTVTDAGGGVVSLPYIVMEHVEGRTLREILSDGRPLDVDLALDVTTGVLNALEYSHRIGIVHRDIKPANVMLTPNGDVKVMDFGIARAMADVSSTMTQTHAVIGTAQYLSPEQARGEQVDTRSDLYSTGCLLFELLTGRPPFVADSPVAVAYQHVGEQPPAPSELAPNIPESIDRIVLHSLVKEREGRYQTAADFRADVEAARGGRQVAAPVPAEATTQYLGATSGPPTGTRALAPVGGGMLGTGPQPVGPTSPYDDRYSPYRGQDDQRSRWKPWIIAGVVLAVLALAGVLVAQLTGDRDKVTTVGVPSVVGQLQPVAEQNIEGEGLTPRVEPREVQDEDQAGKVLEQRPDANTQVERGSTVTLVVGQLPGTVEVPDVVGESQSKAREILREENLTAGEVVVEDISNPDVEPGEVIRTDPQAGEKAKRGTEVKLWVASENVEVPDFTGKKRDDARDQILKLNLVFRERFEVRADATPGTVVSQSPPGGTKVARESRVTIVVAQRPEPTRPSPTPSDTETEPPDDDETPTVTPTTTP